jgi:hypothetical protein
MAGRMVARGLRTSGHRRASVVDTSGQPTFYVDGTRAPPFNPAAAFESEQPLSHGLARDGPIA